MFIEVYEKLSMGLYPIKSKNTEFHHIIPKHMGGNDDPSNLVELDLRQHKIAHYLLWKIYGKDQDKLVWYLRSGKYEEGIEIRKKLHAEYFNKRENNLSKDVKLTFDKIKANLPKLIKSNRIHDKPTMYSQKEYEIDLDSITKERPGKKRIYMFTKSGEYIQSFDCIQSASECLRYNSNGNLHSAATGKRNYAAGFRWSFTKLPNPIIEGKKRIYKKTGKQKNPSNHTTKIYKQIKQYDLSGNLIHIWNNRKEIQENLNISAQMINHVLNNRAGRDGEYRGYVWKKGKQITVVEYKD